MKKILLSFLTLSTVAMLHAQSPVKVSYVSIENPLQQANPVLTFEQPDQFEKAGHTVRLYPEIKFQELTGIGGCFNEIGGEALASLSDAEQAKVLNALFGAESDLKLSMCRMAIGSSDFGIDAYSFSEVKDDYAMEHFSLERDSKYMLPFIQKAVQVNPNLRLFGSPWSPPAWMKHSGLMDAGKKNADKNSLIDDPKIYEAYALYFKKYVEGYKNAGVKVERILIQNEQDINTRYPSCRMPVEQMTKFVSEYMRPLFEKEKIDTEIWAGTFRTAGEHEGLRLAANPEYKKHFDGIGIQYTKTHYIQDMTLLAPEMKIMHTEGVCYKGLNTVEQGAKRFAEVAGYINSGSENYCYWNMILNETGKSGWNWKQNALITINRETKQVTYNPDYVVMALMSRAIKDGDIRIASFSKQSIMTTASVDCYHIIMMNESSKPSTVKVTIDKESYNALLPAKSLCVIDIAK